MPETRRAARNSTIFPANPPPKDPARYLGILRGFEHLPDDRFSFSRYAYYCLRALKIPSPIPDKFITTIQILQMIVVGPVIQGASMYYYSKDEGLSCKVDYWNLVAGGIMYGSYFCLFFHFVARRQTEKRKKKKIGGFCSPPLPLPLYLPPISQWQRKFEGAVGWSQRAGF